MPAPEVSRSVAVPRVPEPTPARRFPLVATLAPIGASLALFAVTRSPFTLMFALMGPLVAVGTLADSALQKRRSRRRDATRLAREFEQALAQVEREHDHERAELDAAHPRAAALGRSSFSSAAAGERPTIRLGTGSTRSSLDLRGFDRAAADDRVTALRDRAANLERAPIVGDPAGGIGIVGDAVARTAVARGIVLQLASRAGSGDWCVEVPDDAEWDWVATLAMPVERAAFPGLVRFRGPKASWEIAFAGRREQLAVRTSGVVVIGSDGRATVDSLPGSFEPEFVPLETARLVAAAISGGATGSPGRTLPDAVDLGSLDQPVASAGLAASIGRDASGQFELDLVTDGPHAIVGGTTGSGKSELLITWMLALAGTRSPDRLTFLFVDFKGGASFDSLLSLPHCVGVITDLDPAGSLRALASLGAELRFRERALAAAGLRSIDDVAEPPFPRLLVVVDEYAALVETHSALHSVFADIAARGRSLGVHLVLCTQRPSGVVRDSILANCPLRISLRVMTAADSLAVIGTDAAANLPPRPPGRALVAIGGERPRLVQVARSSDGDVLRAAGRWRGTQRPRSPWLPPLEPVVRLGTVADPDDSLPFGVADLPELQAQETCSYRPSVDGSLLVVGATRSGKSGVLGALAAAPSSVRVEMLPRELPLLWDALHDARDRGQQPETLLLLDDADSVIANCDESYRAALTDLFTELLRDAPGIRFAMSVQRVGGALQPLAALCGSVLLLRMPNRQEHVLAGGVAAEFTEHLPPGGGHWRGHRVQVFATDALPASVREARTVPVELSTHPLTVVSTRPQQFAELVRQRAPGRSVSVLGPARLGAEDLEVSRGGAEPILVADPETWQAQWSMLGALQRSTDLLFDGCSLAELRAISRSRELPPPFARGQRALWLRTREGETVRARLAELGQHRFQ